MTYVTLYVSIYQLFTSLLHLLGAMGSRESQEQCVLNRQILARQVPCGCLGRMQTRQDEERCLPSTIRYPGRDTREFIYCTFLILDRSNKLFYFYKVATENHLFSYTDQEKTMAVDEMIKDIEDKYEVLSSVVPESRLHEIINNPVDEGIDEG
jgi:hypothetical protein